MRRTFSRWCRRRYRHKCNSGRNGSAGRCNDNNATTFNQCGMFSRNPLCVRHKRRDLSSSSSSSRRLPTTLSTIALDTTISKPGRAAEEEEEAPEERHYAESSRPITSSSNTNGWGLSLHRR